MKLNVGSSNQRGRYKQAEWVCFDLNKAAKPNVVGDAFQMPFADDSFDEIHSVHVLEHLPRDKWPLMLAEIFRVLKPGGAFYVEVPDFEIQCREYLAALRSCDRWRIHLIRTAIWGKPERLGMGHQFGFDAGFLKRALSTIGFVSIKQLTEREDMISAHCRDGGVLLFKSTKSDHRPSVDVRTLTFDELREHIIK